MKITKACAALLLAAFMLLSGCAGREHPPGGASGQETGVPPAGGEEGLRPIPLGQGLADLGRALFPSPAGPISGRLLPGGRLLAWTEDQTVLYDLGSGAVLHRTHLPIRRLGAEHFYSLEQRGEEEYTVTLYDGGLEVLVRHESSRPALPAIDGKTLLYVPRQLATRNTSTGEEKTVVLKDIDGQYQGGIWTQDFDGEWLFFGTTCNPMPGNPGIGAYNLFTGEAVLKTDFPPSFSGIPQCYGGGRALFWQDGSAYGTDGTYCVVMDMTTGAIGRVDVGGSACRMSDNGRYLAVVDFRWEEESSQAGPVRIATYDGGSLEALASRDITLPIRPDSGGGFGEISVSDDGAYVCFTGLLEENGEQRQTLFLYSVEQN